MQKNHWHPAFCSATEWELKENKGNLTYETEHQLSREPLRVDLLVIKKKKDARIVNEIGRIFRKHNLVEFKGPGDALNLDVFHKTLGYAHLYKNQERYSDEIPADEITITIIREAYPRELFKQLKECGIVAHEEYPGIYYLEGKIMFPMQIIVTSRLDQSHAAFRILTNKAQESDVRNFLNEQQKSHDPHDRENADSMLQVSVSANEPLYRKIQEEKDMCPALRELWKDDIEQARAKGKSEGLAEGKAEGLAEGSVSMIRKFMEKSKATAKQAMDYFDIPQKDREKYKALL